MSFVAANKAKAKRHSKKKAGKAAKTAPTTKPAKPESLTVYQAERVLPPVADDKHMRLMQDASSHPDQSCIGVNLIDVRPGNRDPSEFTPEALAELMRSIAQHGLLQPIVVRKKGDKGRYELIAGQRRLAACKFLGWVAVPAITREVPKDDLQTPDELRLAENIDRKPLSFFEEAEQVHGLYVYALAANKDVDGFVQQPHERKAIATVSVRVGKSEHWVRERLMLAQLDDKIRGAVLDGTLSMSIARKLAQIECAEDRGAAARAIVDRIKQKHRGLPTHDEIDRMIGEYLYRLQGVKWRLDVPFAGGPACETCEHNSNNALFRFEQITKDGKPIATFRDGAARNDQTAHDTVVPKEGVCANGACYRKKAEMAKGAVDRAANRAVTHLTRTAEGFEGAKASPRKIAERALQHARPGAIANVVPEGVSAAAVLERVRPRLERMAQSAGAGSGAGKRKDDRAQASKEHQEDQRRRQEAERAARIEYQNQLDIWIEQLSGVGTPLQAYFSKHLDKVLVFELLKTTTPLRTLSEWNVDTRRRALARRELDEALKILNLPLEKAIAEIARMRFGNTGLGKHKPLSLQHADAELALLAKVGRVLGIDMPAQSPAYESAEQFVTRRTAELLNPAPKEPATPRVPKVAPARKSSANRARVPDTDAEEEPPRGAGDVARDEEGSDEL